MTDPVPAPIRRILFALDAYEETTVLEAVASLAARLDAELEALFVEDEELLRLAALPFACELGLTSAVRRPLHDQDIERTLRSRAARSQATLAAVATRTNVRWSFRVIRGQVASRVTEAALQADIVTLSVGGDPMQQFRSRALVRNMLATSARPLLVMPTGTGLQPPYVVVFDGSPAAQRALLLAVQLGMADPAGAVRVLLIEDGVSRRREAEALLSESGVRGDFRALRSKRGEDITRAFRDVQTGTALLPVHAGLLSPEQIERMLGAMGCAALLVP